MMVFGCVALRTTRTTIMSFSLLLAIGVASSTSATSTSAAVNASSWLDVFKNNDQCNNFFCSALFKTWVAVVLAPIFLKIAWGRRLDQKLHEIGPWLQAKRWRLMCQRARITVTGGFWKRKMPIQTILLDLHCREYQATYKISAPDNQEKESAPLFKATGLFFQDKDRFSARYQLLSGGCKDYFDTCDINEGCVDLHSGRAYWVASHCEDEFYRQNETEIQTIIQGKFTEGENDKIHFEGGFHRQNGESGIFVSFVLEKPKEKPGPSTRSTNSFQKLLSRSVWLQTFRVENLRNNMRVTEEQEQS